MLINLYIDLYKFIIMKLTNKQSILMHSILHFYLVGVITNTLEMV